MIDVVPTLRNVVYSLMFESPTITWSRRNRSASACGSSRVLMIGRERVVALDTPSQMCSARWRDAVHRAARGLQHLARAGVDLAGDEERDQHVGELGEVAVALDEVVLVAAVGVAGAVGVVLEEEHLAADALLAEALLGALHEALEDALPRLVVDDEVVDRVALGRRVLGVAADVEVEPGAVLEEDVARAAPRHDPAEQVAGDLVGAEPALAAQRAGDAVLVLESEDAPFHVRPFAAVLRSVRAATSLCKRRGPILLAVADDADSPRCTGRSGPACMAARLAVRGLRRPAARARSTVRTGSPSVTWRGSTCTCPTTRSTKRACVLLGRRGRRGRRDPRRRSAADPRPAACRAGACVGRARAARGRRRIAARSTRARYCA